MKYLCNERSQGRSKGSFGIVDGMPFSGNLFLSIKNHQNKQTYFKTILQALLLVTKQAYPIKGLLKGIHLFVQRCPFLHSQIPLWHAACVDLLSLVDIPKGARSRRERRCPNGLQLCSWALRLILKIPLCRKRDQTLKTIFKKFWGSKKDPFPVWA